MTRFWVSWWSGYYKDEGCTKPPFQIWTTGFRERQKGKHKGDDEESFCAVIDADNEAQIWKAVKKHFPDMEPRFCEPKPNDFDPSVGGRFPGFENRTRLKA